MFSVLLGGVAPEGDGGWWVVEHVRGGAELHNHHTYPARTAD